MTTQPEALRLAAELEWPFSGPAPKQKAAAELRRQHEEIERLKVENAAIGSLLNAYNFGGWTDSLTLIQERGKAQAEIERLNWVKDTANAAIKQLNERLDNAMWQVARVEKERDEWMALANEAKPLVEKSIERKEALRVALEALESCDADGYNPGLVIAALVKIKEVLG